MKDNIKDIVAIIACIGIAYFVAIAASVGEVPFLWNPPVVVLCAGVSFAIHWACLLYTSPSPRDQRGSRMPSSA